MKQDFSEGAFVKVVGVIAGPIFSGDLYYGEGLETEDDEDYWVMQLQVQNDYGGIQVEEFEFDTFEEGYEIVEHFYGLGEFTPFWLDLEDEDEE
ncbi:hypothetical protein UFOVP346_22 [uncultured Caudovirales phage]|uniref:Uncharacterized protein n=1 Tax=uncultured Caudovirales phage TaxID=2100421 RepID=A0A6J5M252_9CAUD|nr:hypothetical protein UFOVP346_22 [uncultured Caudovirales phage]